MKTYYDLTKKDRKQYKKEFKDTPVGKEIFFIYYCMLVLVCIFSSMWGFSKGLTTGLDVVNNDFLFFSNCVGIISLVLVVIGTIWECYIVVSFSSWLKYKHDVKRW